MLDTDKTKPIVENPANNADSTKRKAYSWDDKYIEAYCNNPIAGKTEALLSIGFAGNNVPQEAYRMHKRLRDRITARTDELINDLAELAASQLQALLKGDAKEIGYANMSKAIQQGLDYAGRKPGDKLTIVKEQSIDDIEADLEAVNAELSKTLGIRTH